MPAGRLRDVLHHLRRASVRPHADLTDGQMLARFLERRHGPMVLAACRRPSPRMLPPGLVFSPTDS
jgi:hypothetical protein